MRALPTDERYIVEMFDDVNVVSRGTHDDGHAQAALAAFQKFVEGARARDAGPRATHAAASKLAKPRLRHSSTM